MLTDERTSEEISAAIAERLFGKVIEDGYEVVTASDGYRYRMSIKLYASDHNAALGLVVPKMRRRGYEFWMSDRRGRVQVSFSADGKYSVALAEFGQEPRAICLAAEAALDAERKAE